MATLTSFDLNGSGTGLNESRTFQEGASAILLAPSAALSASGNFNGQSLRLSGLLAEAQIGFSSGVSLAGTSVRVGGVTVGSVSGGTNGADFVIAFNSNATASRVQTVLRNLTYADVSDTPTPNQTISFNLAGTVRIDAITVVPVNDRPVLDLNGAASGTSSSASFIENRSVAVSPNATLTDPDTSSLVALTATLLARPDGNALERLSLDAAAASAAAAAGLSVTYSASTGALSIDGSASAVTYQAILRGILYENGSDQPSTATRTVRVSASDGTDVSLVRDASISITRVNDAPLLDLNGAAAGTGVTLSYRTGDAPAKFAAAATVADIDSANFGGGSLRIGFMANGSAGDQLLIITDATVTISGTTVRVNGTSIGTVSGGTNGNDLVVSLNTSATPAAVQTLLQHVGFSTGAGSPTSPREVTFTLNDGDGTANGGQAVASAVATIELTAGQGNVAPTLTGDLQATIANGSTYQFTTSDFFYTDPDDGPAGVTFSVSNIDNGFVRRNGTAVSSFTAEQLAAGQITYWHDGTEPVGSFRIAVEDGNEDGSTPVAQSFVFNVTTGQVNTPPTLTGDLQATIANGSTYQFTTSDFFYTDPDDGPAGVTFSVSNIDNGFVRRNGTAVSSFTAEHLAAGQITYWHDGTEPVGSFRIAVEDGNEDGSTPVAQNFVFNVTTGQVNTPPTLTGDLQATIANGSTYQFTTSDFFYTDPDDGPAGVTFSVSNIDNGFVRRNGTAVSSFTAEQLAAGQITYWHDGTEPVGSFRIAVEDGNEDGSTPVAQNFVFNVTTGQVNTPPTLTGDLRATIASGGSYVLSQADLFYSDLDDSATGVAFTASGVAGGTLLVAGAAAMSFTPQQLTNGLVAFRHDGSSTAPSFSVSVEDGNEDGSTPVAQSFILDVGTGGSSALDLSGAVRGVRVDLGAAQWVLATKVMALGDSITNGDSPPGQDEHGYRGFLYQNLVEAGRLVDLVGPNSNGQVPDPQHAGYPGETGDDIQALLPNLLATYTPSAILLMVGTNDVLQKSNPQNAVSAEIVGMLNHVAQASPATHVYVATLLPLAGHDTQIANVNAAIRSVVADAVGRGQNVSLVEMPSVALSDLFDGIHPNDTGYRKMAGYWTTAFLAKPPAAGMGTAIDAAVTKVTGSSHNDLLIGDGRANELSGGAGADWIRGEAGNDLLTGGAGRDVFVFAPGFGQDTVRDFVRGEDLLDFKAFALNVGDFASWRQDHISASGADAIVTIEPGHSVTLTGVSAIALQASDFLFV
ncbi:GDSL-type esterase/lipase family protein [Boseaceae bacterium BT-24-1]|nr:GDSL-type esterase/lipase family protein [Boseaceae bacterium BT-24-1]